MEDKVAQRRREALRSSPIRPVEKAISLPTISNVKGKDRDKVTRTLLAKSIFRIFK